MCVVISHTIKKSRCGCQMAQKTYKYTQNCLCILIYRYMYLDYMCVCIVQTQLQLTVMTVKAGGQTHTKSNFAIYTGWQMIIPRTHIHTNTVTVSLVICSESAAERTHINCVLSDAGGQQLQSLVTHTHLSRTFFCFADGCCCCCHVVGAIIGRTNIAG